MAKIIATALAIALASTAPASAADIDSCKYLVVTDFTEDPYGIAKELRTQGRAKGFFVVAGPLEVPSADVFMTCVMLGNWSVSGSSGRLTVRVVDAVSGAVIADASAGATNWWGIERTVRGGVRKIYDQLRYTGYKEDVYRARVEKQYPPRPKLSITEAELRGSELHSRVEGIWTDREDQYPSDYRRT